MNKFLDTHTLPRLNYKKVEHPKRWTVSSENEAAIKTSIKEKPGLDGFHCPSKKI